jgi:hypothetical protein
MTPRPFRTGLPFLLLAFVSPPPLAAQTGPDLMRRAAAAHEERLSGVENVTIVQDMMGMETTVYMERQEVGGTPTLVPVETRVSGMTVQVPEMQNSQWSAAFQDEWIERTRAEGTEVVDGRTLQVLVIDDFGELYRMRMTGPGAQEMEVITRRIRYLLDPSDLVLRRMTMEGEVERADGRRVPFETDMHMDDYREIDGYLHPFVTRMRSSGMMAVMDVDQEEMRAQLAQMRERWEGMPENQRGMMGGMIREQMERMEAMLGDDGSVEMVTTVRELRVNAVRPGR